jgi:short-subunit dehydrogenase
MYSETLRVEVAPLGVKVVTIMTGIVASKMFENTPHDELPDTSCYQAAGPNVAEIASGDKFASVAMPVATYAKGVVDDVLRGRTGMAWRGKIVSIGWFVHSFFPTWMKKHVAGVDNKYEKGS